MQIFLILSSLLDSDMAGIQALLGVMVFGFSSILLFQFRRLSSYQRKLENLKRESEKPAALARDLEIENRSLAEQLDSTPFTQKHIEELHKANAAHEKQIEILNLEIETLRDSNHQSISNIASLRNEIERKNALLKETEEYKQQLTKLQDLLATRETTIKTLSEENALLQSTIDKQQIESKRSLEENSQEMKLNLKQAEAQSNDSKNQVTSLTDTIIQLNKQLEEVTLMNNESQSKSQNLIETQTNETNELKKANELLQKQVETLGTRVEASKTFTDECERLRARIAELETSLAQEKEYATSLQLEIEEKQVKTMHDDEKRHLEELNMQVEEYAKKLEELQEERQEISEGESVELQEARKEIETNVATISTLEKSNEALTDAINTWKSKFTTIEKSLMAQVQLESNEKPEIEELLCLMTKNLHSIQEELQLQHQTTEKIQNEHLEDIQRQTQTQAQKDLELVSLDKELVLTRQRYNEIQIQFQKEKETFQERHTQLREALKKIEELQNKIQIQDHNSSLASSLPVEMPESPSIRPNHEELPISIHDDDEEVQKVLEFSEDSSEAPVPSTMSPDDLEKREKLLRQRSHVLKEIYHTEQSYVSILDMVFLNFIVPLKKAIAEEETILSESELRIIFPSWEVIRGYNTLFLEQLKERIDNWEETQCVGDLFIEICIWLKSYSSYINSFDAAAQKFLEVSKRDSFKSFLNTARSKKALKRQDLSSYLIAPVQRLPRYVLLLKEMVKCTPEDHEDYKPLQQALESITSIADTVNASKLLHESKEMMIGCASRFIPQVSNQIIAPHRTYVCEGIFYRTAQVAESPAETLNIKDLHILILFSDILVHAKPNESFDIEQFLSLKKPMASPRPGTAHKSILLQDLELKKIYKVSCYDIIPAEKNKLGMKIKETGKSSSSPLKFFAKTEDDKSDWLLIYDSTKRGIPDNSDGRKRRRSFFNREK